MKRIAVIDIGLGTARAVKNLISHLEFDSDLISKPDEAKNYSHLILPGVGHFQEGAKLLETSGFFPTLTKFVEEGNQLFGICLGMQLLGISSEEGSGIGLGLIPMISKKLQPNPSHKVPNMGWSNVKVIRHDPIVEGIDDLSRFYFVHSFAVPVISEATVATSVHSEEFTSIVRRDNVLGVQFHPEKSHRFGKIIMANFLKEKA